MDTKPSSEDILNAILPPREFVDTGKHMINYVSHNSASRVDVARLREMLDQKLMERQARESGICPNVSPSQDSGKSSSLSVSTRSSDKLLLLSQKEVYLYSELEMKSE
jgi:hypothetical protein